MQIIKLNEKAVGILSFLLLGAAISYLSWQSGWLIFLLGLPVAYRISTNKWQICAVYFGYYLFGSQTLLEIIPTFFDGQIEATGLMALFVWALWAAVLSLPFLIWNQKIHRHYIIATLITVAPPLGIFGWMSNLNVAGLLFPSMGSLGMFLCLAFMSFAAVGSWRQLKWALIILVPISISANVQYEKAFEVDDPMEFRYQDKSTAPYIIRAMNTDIPKNGSKLSMADDLENINYLKKKIAKELSSRKSGSTMFLVLPEEVLGAWRPAKALFWGGFIQQLEAENVFLIAGGDRHIKGTNIFEDAVFLMTHVKKDGIEYAKPVKLTAAKIPMPGGNWNLFNLGDKTSATMDLFASKNSYQVMVNGQLIHFSVCYEDFLIWPHLSAAYSSENDKPKLMISLANNWFQTEQTLAYKVQRDSIGAMSRLFGVKLLRAVNI